MISPLPYRHMLIETFLSTDRAASLLSGALGSLHSKPSIFRWFQGNPRDFKGTASSDGFMIKRVYPSWLYDSFLPVLYGRFKPHEHATQIDVHIMPRPLTIAIVIIFFIAGAYEIASYTQDWISTKSLDKGFVYTLIIILIGYGMMIVSFNHQADISRDFIEGIFKRYSE